MQISNITVKLSEHGIINRRLKVLILRKVDFDCLILYNKLAYQLWYVMRSHFSFSLNLNVGYANSHFESCQITGVMKRDNEILRFGLVKSF